MNYHTRKLVKPADLNSANTLFGGTLLAWIDEECYIYARCQLGTDSLVTKFISEIDFKSPATQGDVVEIGVETVAVGRTSITLRCEARNKGSQRLICYVGTIVFVHVDHEGKAVPHGK